MATAMCHSSAGASPKGIRFCASCLAVYRQDFQRCPLDGGTLVMGAHDPWLGLTVGSHYVIDGLIGEGAMGRVYRAHHRQFSDRRYAVKILIGDLAASAQMRTRFSLEAEHARRLAHPNVVGVIDFGATERGIDHMVMELVEGPTLGELLRGGPMDPERVIVLARQIAEGLDHAHGRGMIHRDLKPDNVLVVSEREHEIARIADFGLSLSKHNETRLTTTGVVCTPAYAAPEQLRGGDIDHRVDLYALGVSMFEMLSGGILPFDGDVDSSVKRKLSSDAPSVHMVAPNVPPALVAIVGRLLSPDPGRRPRSARAVIRALDQALSAPRVEMKTDQTAPLRAQALASEPPSVPPEAEAYSSLTVERMLAPRPPVRRAVVQLAACAMTLSGVLAWADLEGLMSPRADASVQARPAAAAMQVATRRAPRSLPHTLAAVPRRVPALFASAFPVVVEAPVAIPSALVLAPSASTAIDIALAAQPDIQRANGIDERQAREERPASEKRVERAPVRRVKARRVVRARRPEPRQQDVVDQMLDAALAQQKSAADAATEPATDPATAPATEMTNEPAIEPPVETTIEVPGPPPTPAVATPPVSAQSSAPERDAYDEPFPAEQP